MIDSTRPRPEPAAGFTLVELLVAALITLVVTGTVLALVGPAQQIFQAQPEVADLQQRMRVGVDSLRRDLVMAGAGPYAGAAWGTLGDAFAPVMPYRAFGDAPDPGQGTRFRSDAVSIIYVPPTASQTVLASPLLPGALVAQVAPSPNCPAQTTTQVCGLASGDRIVIFDRIGHWDIYTVDQVTAGILMLQHRGEPAVASYPAGAAVAEVRLGTYYLRVDGATGTSQLMRYNGWASDLPVVDDVVDLQFRYFGLGEPPRRTSVPLDVDPGPWTTYGPAPPGLDSGDGSWPDGENCVFAVAAGDHQPRLATLGVGEVELTGDVLADGPWCPDPAWPGRFDADLLRVRRVQVTVRVQVESPAFRGPAGALFRNGGTARAGQRMVPDRRIDFSVSPRNLNLER